MTKLKLTKRGYITTMIRETSRCFIANLNHGGIRIGALGSLFKDYPQGHADIAGLLEAAAVLDTADSFDAVIAREVGHLELASDLEELAAAADYADRQGR